MRNRENRFLKGCIVLCVILILAVMTGLSGVLQRSMSTSTQRNASSTEQPVFQEVEIPAGEVEGKYYYSTLTDEEKQVYQMILCGIRENAEKINVEMTDAGRVNEIYQFVLNDFPEIFWCSGAAETTAYRIPEGGYSEFCPEYSYDGEQKEQMQNRLKQRQSRFLRMQGPRRAIQSTTGFGMSMNMSSEP